MPCRRFPTFALAGIFSLGIHFAEVLCDEVLCAELLGTSTSACACEIRVRDSAFRTTRDIHKVCVIADSTDESADAIQDRLEQWIQTEGDAINLQVVRVDADDPETNWQSIGIPSAPPSLPVTVLVGRDNGIAESFVIDHWEPAPSDKQLSSILDSPARRKLAEELAENVAVLVFAPRDPNSQTIERLQSLVDAGVAEERIGLSMITIDREDPAERLLCRFMGLRADSPETVCVAFGRGKLMSPPLVGDDINGESINTLVTQIRQACSCSRPLQTMGVDLPLVWTNSVDSKVVLMDEELDLSELDTEVQNMLAAKATTTVITDPDVVPIPPGDTAESIVTSDPPDNSQFQNRFSLGLFLIALAGVAFMTVIAGRRLFHTSP